MSASEARTASRFYQSRAKWVQDFYVSPDTRLRRGPIAAVCPRTRKCRRAGPRTRWSSSKNPGRSIMYVADGTNNVVWILDRKTGKTLGRRWQR